MINFPVFLNTPGTKLPETGIYYVVAKDGIYMRTDRNFGSALVKVEEIPHLAVAPTQASFNLPKIPATIIGQALMFFREVFVEHKTESYLTLLYSKKLGQYRLWCPRQEVSYSSVSYDRTDSVPVEERNYMGSDGPGWQSVGTIHSHCDFSAFHSGTDEFDESTFDGIHITLGHVNRNDFSIVASIAINDNRFPKAIADVCDGVPNTSSEVVEEEGDGPFKGQTFKRQELYHRLVLNDKQQAWLDNELETTIRKEWLPKVTKRIWISSKGVGRLFSTEEIVDKMEFDGLEQGLFPDSGPRIEDGVYVDEEDDISIQWISSDDGFEPTERQLRKFGYRRDDHGFKYGHDGD
jgi:hypothetical protein